MALLSLPSQLYSEKALCHLGPLFFVHTHPWVGLISDSVYLHLPSVSCSPAVEPGVGEAEVSWERLTHFGSVSEV